MNRLQFEAHLIKLALANGFPDNREAWEALKYLPRQMDMVARLLFTAGKTDEILRCAMVYLDTHGQLPTNFQPWDPADGDDFA